jgi:hypothetical protein
MRTETMLSIKRRIIGSPWLTDARQPATGPTPPGVRVRTGRFRLDSDFGFPLPWETLVPDLDPSDPHRWFLFRPPFFGFLFRFLPETNDNFRLDRRLFLDPSAGLVGNEVTMDCDDAGDIEFAWATAEAQIAFGFEAHIAGVVEVLIDAQSTPLCG